MFAESKAQGTGQVNTVVVPSGAGVQSTVVTVVNPNGKLQTTNNKFMIMLSVPEIDLRKYRRPISVNVSQMYFKCKFKR